MVALPIRRLRRLAFRGRTLACGNEGGSLRLLNRLSKLIKMGKGRYIKHFRRVRVPPLPVIGRGDLRETKLPREAQLWTDLDAFTACIVMCDIILGAAVLTANDSHTLPTYWVRAPRQASRGLNCGWGRTRR
jgi:hypothetical protein